MADEKVAVSLNRLNTALAKQIDKRETAGTPSPAAAQVHLNNVTTAAESRYDDFFDAWDKYYPTIISMLGYVSWLMPGKTITTIKSLLAVVNNQILPILRDMAK